MVLERKDDPVKQDVQIRFWSKVDLNGPTRPGMPSPCWLWTTSVFDDGYGKFWFNGRNHPAQRVSWWLETGRWPSPMALHKCDTPACVRYDHLFEGDAGDNARDREAKGRSQSIVGDLNPSRQHPETVRRGAQHHGAKLTQAIVDEIRQKWVIGDVTQVELALTYGISKAQMCGIINNKFWRQS